MTMQVRPCPSCDALQELQLGAKKESCAKCGDWIGSHGTQAKLCNECSFGPKKGECAVCGHWIGSEGAPAMLCQQCGFSSKKDHCVKCGSGRRNF